MHELTVVSTKRETDAPTSLMLVALVYTYRASRKEPLADVLERIHAAFLTSGLGEPAIQFSLADSPLGGMSSVDRVVKRHPALQQLVWSGSPLPTLPPIRQISNDLGSPVPGHAVPFDTLLAIAKGVPRSFPLHKAMFHFRSPAFGVAVPAPAPLGAMPAGVIVGDSWWVSGRSRSVSAVVTVEVADDSATRPSAPAEVAAVLEACGKIDSTAQVPLAGGSDPSHVAQPLAPPPGTAQAVSDIIRDYRARLAEVIDRASLPHDLPPALEALQTIGRDETTGPKKPVLVRAFKPLGYDCRGGSGTFTLRRRTAGNITVELELDVGTWSRSLTTMYRVVGLGFRVVLPLPASKRAMGSVQYKIGDAANWQKIVDNLAALVAELDRSLVPAIEAAAGPSPKWFNPES
jgi:hypothetical protein